MRRGWLVVLLGGFVTSLASVVTAVLVALNALDNPDPQVWQIAWAVVVAGLLGGALVAAMGFRRLGSVGRFRPVAWGLLTAATGLIVPWLLAAVWVRMAG